MSRRLVGEEPTERRCELWLAVEVAEMRGAQFDQATRLDLAMQPAGLFDRRGLSARSADHEGRDRDRADHVAEVAVAKSSTDARVSDGICRQQVSRIWANCSGCRSAKPGENHRSMTASTSALIPETLPFETRSFHISGDRFFAAVLQSVSDSRRSPDAVGDIAHR